MMTKKNILIISGIGWGLFILLLLALLYDFCGPYRHVCKSIYSPIAYASSSFPFVFLLSLLTYRAKDQVFRAWWDFAKWWVPVIIGVTLFFEYMGSSGGGWGMNGGAFNAFFIGIFYVIFILVSLVRITQAYLKTK